jgi:hypothetical protein
MALTASVANINRGHVVGTLNLGNSYATGGMAVTPSQIGCPNKLYYLDISNANGLTFQYIPSTGKIKAFWSNTSGSRLAEVTAATDLSAAADNPQFQAFGT